MGGLLLLLGVLFSCLLQLSQAQGNQQIEKLYPKQEKVCQLPNGKEGICVYAYLCKDGKVQVHGQRIIDIRSGDVCEEYLLKCCSTENSCQRRKGQCVTQDLCGIPFTAQTSDPECHHPTSCCPTQSVIQAPPGIVAESITQNISASVDEENCSGAWVPPTQCRLRTDGIGKIHPRGFNTLVCCPQKYVNPEQDDPPLEKCSQDTGFCVAPDQCDRNVHGRGTLQPRNGECSRDTTCCKTEHLNQATCTQSSSVWVPTDECRLQSSFPKSSVVRHMCCPPEQVIPQEPSGHNVESCLGGSGFCVAPDQCYLNIDGRGHIQPRIDACSEHTLCCRTEHLLHQATCTQISGVWVPTDECTLKSNNTIQHMCCPPEQVISKNNQDIDPPSTEAPPKKCHHGYGTCVEKSCCKGSIKDRLNECDGLTCCEKVITSCLSDISNISTSTEEPATVPPVAVTTDKIARSNCLGETCQIPLNCDNSEGDTECESTGEFCGIQSNHESRGCGFRNTKGVCFEAENTIEGESQYGEYPWMVAIMVLDNGNKKYICGGSLIDSEVVLTTANCVKSYRFRADKLIVRAGEWDMNSTIEPHEPSEIGVKAIKIHQHFVSSSLINNVALLFLQDNFKYSRIIDTICLPPPNFDIHNGYVVASGWGATPKDRTRKPQILKSIELPYCDRDTCQSQMRKKISNKKFKLHQSFICAGGDNEIDTCAGDQGSPIIFEIPDVEDRYYIVGMVSWGIGCGEPGTPAAYTDVSNFREWIDKQFEDENIPSHDYTYDPDR